MRKLLVSLAFAAFALVSSASAQINFAGLEWGSSAAAVKRALVAKGYEYVESEDADGGMDQLFYGTIGKAEAEFILRYTPEGSLQCVTIVTDELSNPSQQFNAFVDALNDRYGDPSDEEDKRSNQFQGVSSATQISQGIRMGDIYMSHRWVDEDEGAVLRMETLKGGYLRFDYYGPEWSDEYDRRQAGKTNDL